MTINREKFVFCFKALLCISLIALWSFWFTNSSREIRQKKVLKHSSHIQSKKAKKEITPKTEVTEIVHQTIPDIMTENKKSPADNKIKDSKISKDRTNLQNNLVKELPKLATLTPVKTITEKDSNKLKEGPSMPADLKNEKPKVESSTPKEMINLNLPEVALATRKVLLNDSKKNRETPPGEHNPTLRKTVQVERNKLKPISISLKENRNRNIGQKTDLEESWLPKYNENTKKTIPENLTNNPDKIAEQIELSGIVNKPDGESTAIIRNKINNYIEILKKGDKYKGLKLLEINKNEVVLLDETLNKTYIKKINTGE